MRKIRASPEFRLVYNAGRARCVYIGRWNRARREPQPGEASYSLRVVIRAANKPVGLETIRVSSGAEYLSSNFAEMAA